MGLFDTYCAFCAGPLENARDAWLSHINISPGNTWPPKDGEWLNSPGSPVPSRSKEDIISISSEDGLFWSDWVCVSPLWQKEWVSPSCRASDYGEIFIQDSSEWQNDAPRYLRIHRGCLSFVCHRLDITPRTLWESFYQEGADYLRYGEEYNGLLYCLSYYDMEGRNGQFFGYSIQRQTRTEDANVVNYWHDPDSMEDAKWILSRPTDLPIPSQLTTFLSFLPPHGTTSRICMKVFGLSELLDLILSFIINVSEPDAAIELQASAPKFEPPSVVLGTQSIFNLLRVNRFFHHAIVHERQGLFLRLAWEFGWMLPACPADWHAWHSSLDVGQAGPHVLNLGLGQTWDWRAYLLLFLRKEDPHVRNRWRFHRMTVQFARGKARLATETQEPWRWSVGKLGHRTSLVPPNEQSWEQGIL